MGEDSFENHQSILSDCFTVEFSKDTTSQQVDIHKLTKFFKSLITNKEDILSIKGIVNFTKFWRNNDSTQIIDFNLSFWKSCFGNISDQSLSKFIRDAYYRLLHRIYIPFAINSGNDSIFLFCKKCLTIRFCSDHAIFECPIKKELWKILFKYLTKTVSKNVLFMNISILSILSLGMHNLNINCSEFDRFVIKNVVGIAISTIIHYPICSNESVTDICGNFKNLKIFMEFFFMQYVKQSVIAQTRLDIFNKFDKLNIIFDSKPTSMEKILWKDVIYRDPLN